MVGSFVVSDLFEMLVQCMVGPFQLLLQHINGIGSLVQLVEHSAILILQHLVLFDQQLELPVELERLVLHAVPDVGDLLVLQSELVVDVVGDIDQLLLVLHYLVVQCSFGVGGF